MEHWPNQELCNRTIAKALTEVVAIFEPAVKREYGSLIRGFRVLWLRQQSYFKISDGPYRAYEGMGIQFEPC